MKIGSIVNILRGMFASYEARVVAIHADGTVDGVVTIFGQEGVLMGIKPTDLLPEEPSAPRRRPTRAAMIAERDQLEVALGWHRHDAAAEVASEYGLWIRVDADTFRVPAWLLR